MTSTTTVAYRIPRVPDMAWTAEPSARRRWLGRGVLAGILLVQAALSLRLRNTAFEDEALYLSAGRLYLDNLLHGTPIGHDYGAYFSGSPYLYPTLAAAIDGVAGLEGARAFSLALMLGVTGLLYWLTRLLFNERTALFAAATFAALGPTALIGRYATYDALALFLLALAMALVVRGGRGSIWWCVLAAPVAALAIPVKYASALYVPTIVVLAVMVALPHRKRRSALLRAPLLIVATGALTLAAFLWLGGLGGVGLTTTNRPAGIDSPWKVLTEAARYGGVMLLVALLGAVLHVHRGRMGEVPVLRHRVVPSPTWRFWLGAVLVGTALLAPAYQAHLHTTVSLNKHVGYGLLFAAPMAGVGISRVVGAHFRWPQLGIAVWVAMLVTGMVAAEKRYLSWPNTAPLMKVLETKVDSHGQYLSAVPQIPLYYLDGRTRPEQWASTYHFETRNSRGEELIGMDAYRRAIQVRQFDLIVLTHNETAMLDDFIVREARRTGHYRLIAVLPYRTTIKRGAMEVWGRA